MLRYIVMAAARQARACDSFQRAGCDALAWQSRTVQAATSTSPPAPSTGSAILREFDADPKAAAKTVSGLPEAHRARIVEALLAEQDPPGTAKYLNTLFKDADLNSDGRLCVYVLPLNTLAQCPHDAELAFSTRNCVQCTFIK